MTEIGRPSRLGDQTNVVRYVGGSYAPESPDGSGIVILPGAFDRKDEDGLSFIQRLILAKAEKQDKDRICLVFASRRTPGKTAVFAEMNVGDALQALSVFDNDFFFIEDPLPAEGEMLANPAHALLVGLPFPGVAIGSIQSEFAGQLLASVVLNTFPAIKP
jgi:hypothetical protein